MQLIERLEPARLPLQKIARRFHKVGDKGNEAAEPGVEVELSASKLEIKIDERKGNREFAQLQNNGVVPFAFAAGKAGADIPVGNPVF